MKNLKFAEALNNEVENVVENTKVSAAFVQELKEAFLMFPVRTDMRFKQSSKGELIISVTVVYATGMTQHFEGAGDADLISAIHFGMAKIIPQFGIKLRLVACEDRYASSLPMPSDMGCI